MGKAKRATRKELEEVVGSVIEEMQKQGQFLQGLSGFMGEYIKFKGDSLAFNDFIRKEAEKRDTASTESEGKDKKSDKKERYKKVSDLPPL